MHGRLRRNPQTNIESRRRKRRRAAQSAGHFRENGRPLSRENAIVLDDPMVVRPRHKQGDDRSNQYAADEMPDEDPGRKQLVRAGACPTSPERS